MYHTGQSPFLFLLEVGEILESGGMAPVEGRAYCEGGEEGECGGRGALRLLRLLAAGQVDPPTDPLRHHNFLQGQSQEMKPRQRVE